MTTDLISAADDRGLELATRVSRLKHRMHNKLFIVDGDRAIFGGRNAAAEHFGLDSRFSLIDFDVLLERLLRRDPASRPASRPGSGFPRPTSPVSWPISAGPWLPPSKNRRRWKPGP